MTEEEEMDLIDDSLIREYAIWMIYGIQPDIDSFLAKVLTNKLNLVWAYADEVTTPTIHIWGKVLHLYAPKSSYGTGNRRQKFKYPRLKVAVPPDSQIWPTPKWKEIATDCWMQGRPIDNARHKK